MKSKIPKIIVFLILTCNHQITYSQSTTQRKMQYPSISVNYENGNIIQTTDFVKGNNALKRPMTNFQSFTAKMLWQNPGYTQWQKIYKSPYYGGGVTLNNFNNLKEVGIPISVYGILGIPVMRGKKLQLYSEFQYGMAFGWKPYDSIKNPLNTVIGGKITVHAKLTLNAFYPISKKIDLGTGLSFVHFSNGGFERPNKGFNIIAPSVELKYHINKRPNVKNISTAKKVEKKNEFLLMAGYGNHQLNDFEFDSNYFSITGISALYLHQFSNAFKLGVGTDINYWMGLNANTDGTPGPRNSDNLTAGFILQPEFVLNKLTLVGGFGLYAKNYYYGNFKQTYQRLGFRYKLYKEFSLGVNVRAVNLTLAEFMEFNLGYSF